MTLNVRNTRHQFGFLWEYLTEAHSGTHSMMVSDSPLRKVFSLAKLWTNRKTKITRKREKMTLADPLLRMI